MKLKISTVLPASIETIHKLMLKPSTLHFVSFPILEFDSVNPAQWAEQWAEGNHVVKMKLFGLFPLGRQNIKTSFPNKYSLRDNGSGQLAQVWDHWIDLEPSQDQSTTYTDSVEIKAGLFTIFIWLFALFLYWHRQRRWHRLVNQTKCLLVTPQSQL